MSRFESSAYSNNGTQRGNDGKRRIMENERILVGSISYAIKAKRLLAKEGIASNLIKDSTHTSGCSYGLSFDPRDAFRISAVLSEAGIRTKGPEDRG